MSDHMLYPVENKADLYNSINIYTENLILEININVQERSHRHQIWNWLQSGDWTEGSQLESWWQLDQGHS